MLKCIALAELYMRLAMVAGSAIDCMTRLITSDERILMLALTVSRVCFWASSTCYSDNAKDAPEGLL